MLRSHLLPRCVLDCLSFLAPTLISMLAPQPLRSGSPELPERLIPGLECSVCVGLVAQSCPTFCDCMECSPPGSTVHGDYPGKNIRVGCHALLHGIFPTQGSNPGLPHCSHQGSPSCLVRSLETLNSQLLCLFVCFLSVDAVLQTASLLCLHMVERDPLLCLSL